MSRQKHRSTMQLRAAARDALDLMEQRYRRALVAVRDVIECTYAHNEQGQRLDEPSEHSAADIVEMLCNIEFLVSEALE
jgi:hypothetical protein